jgi:hypothetical protein
VENPRRESAQVHMELTKVFYNIQIDIIELKYISCSLDDLDNLMSAFALNGTSSTHLKVFSSPESQ